MIAIKPGVKIRGIHPEITLGLIILVDVFNQYGAAVTITSVTEGKHSRGSRHYIGHAIDIRSKHLAQDTKEKILKDAIYRLGADFDIILEGEGTMNEHFHLEWDPKI